MRFLQRLGEHVRKLVFSVDCLYSNWFILYVVPKMVIFDCNMLSSWPIFRRLLHSNAKLLSLNILECVTGNSGFIWITLAKSNKILLNRIKSRILWLSTIYSSSVVEKAISVYILLTHNSGHPEKMMVYPVLDKTNAPLSTSSWSKHPAKSVSTCSLMHLGHLELWLFRCLPFAWVIFWFVLLLLREHALDMN